MSAREKTIADAARELARSCPHTPGALDGKYYLALQVQPGLPTHIIHALDVIVRAVYAAGREDERAQAHRERLADMLDNARDDR